MKRTFRLRIDTYARGGAVISETLKSPVFTSLDDARAEASSRQRLFDRDCAPVQALIVDDTGIPLEVSGCIVYEEDGGTLGEQLRAALSRG